MPERSGNVKGGGWVVLESIHVIQGLLSEETGNVGCQEVRVPKATLEQVFQEQLQHHETRRPIFRRLRRELGKPLVTMFTSFVYPVSLDPSDADALESLLQKLDLSEGLILMVNSPGGNPLAAEQIIRICRSYSGTGGFDALVPSKAKSAATMICLGADRIIMGPTSELGPVDPQIVLEEDGEHKWFSAHNLVAGYEELFAGAVKTKGNVEPFLQQLSRYDDRQIQQFKTAINLSEDIAVKALASGMMPGCTKDEIREKIRVFLEPRAKVVEHGRGIHRGEAKSCDLVIEEWEVQDKRWKMAHELCTRTNQLVSNQLVKSIESVNDSWGVAAIPPRGAS